MKREAEGFICSITIDGLTKTDAGSDSEHDAFKGGASDSFKRAAKLWGFGRDLDNYPPIWIEIDSPNQKYAKIQDAQRKELDKISSAMRTGEEIKEFYYLKK